MRRLAYLIAIAATGCSSILGLEDGTPLVFDAGLDAIALPDAPTVDTQIFVDQGSGDDANDGSASAPLATISVALERAAPGWTIRVGPGTYTNEAFPLDLSFFPGLSIVGDEATKGLNRVIEIDFDGALLNLGDNQLRGIRVTNTLGDGVAVLSDGAVVSGCIISGANDGLLVNAAEAEITDNRLTASGTGLRLGTAFTGVFTGNAFVGNNVGVEVSADAVLDGADGANEFSCNTLTDLRATGAIAVNADSNNWDHAPPTEEGQTDAGVGDAGGGIDITAQNGATVSANNPGLVSSPCL